MKDTKRRMELYSFYDRTGLEQHLTRMAEQGWLLDHIGQFLWTYRRVEPRTLTFSVCYFPSASQFDPGPSEAQETFYDFCRHSGWTLAASSAQLQVFYNQRPHPVPINTDPMTELNAIHRTMMRGQLPSHLILLAVALLNAAMLVWRMMDDPVGTLSSSAYLFSAACWVVVFLITAVEWGGYFLWRRRALQAAERGEFWESRSHRKLQIGALLFIAALLTYYLLTVFTSGNRMMIAMMIIMLFVYTPGLILLGNRVRSFLKRKKASKRFNMAVTVLSIFAAACALMGVMVFGMLFGGSHGWFAGDEDTYTYHGATFPLYQDELPLSVEDLTDFSSDSYVRERRVSQTFLLARFDIRQHAQFGAADYKTLPNLEYTVTLVKAPFLYDLCKNALIHGREDRWNRNEPEEEWYAYQPVDPAPWGAVEAYQWVHQDDPWNTFLLCYEDRLVEIQFDFQWEEIAPDQMATVGEKLGR